MKKITLITLIGVITISFISCKKEVKINPIKNIEGYIIYTDEDFYEFYIQEDNNYRDVWTEKNINFYKNNKIDNNKKINVIQYFDNIVIKKLDNNPLYSFYDEKTQKTLYKGNESEGYTKLKDKTCSKFVEYNCPFGPVSDEVFIEDNLTNITNCEILYEINNELYYSQEDLNNHTVKTIKIEKKNMIIDYSKNGKIYKDNDSNLKEVPYFATLIIDDVLYYLVHSAEF